jgi:hypothetical protein
MSLPSILFKESRREGGGESFLRAIEEEGILLEK